MYGYFYIVLSINSAWGLGLKCRMAQVVAVDLSFTLFERVWCIAELAEAKQLRLQQLLGQWIERKHDWLLRCFFVLLFAGCLSCSFVVVVVVVVVVAVVVVVVVAAAKGKTRSTAVL